MRRRSLFVDRHFLERDRTIADDGALSIQAVHADHTRRKVPDIISADGGRILVRGGDPLPFDGAMPQRHFVVVECDSPESVRIFRHSDAYQAVLPVRLNAGASNGFACLLTSVE
jgi:uncharacterized protein (DUF1330 family)